MKNNNEIEDLSFLNDLSYIDLFSAGDKGIGFIDSNGIVQTDSNVAKVLRTFGNIEHIYFSEENQVLIIAFENGDAIRIYKDETIIKFFNLLKENSDLYDKYQLQIARINKKQEKKALKATSKKVKRENKHTRNIAKLGLSAVSVLLIGTSVVTYVSMNRDKVDIPDVPEISDDSYELPETTATTEATKTTEATTTTESTYITDLTFSSDSIGFDNSTSTYTTPSTIIDKVEDEPFILNYEDRRHNPKATLCKENYYELISKYATMYGIDPNLMLAIATQERGTHSEKIDVDGGLGLMQLQYSIWHTTNGAVLSAYNYETNETDVFECPLQDMEKLENNVRYGCMIFQNCMRYMNNNPIAAIQCYNFGSSNMKKVFNSYYISTGITMEEALADEKNLDWLDYRIDAQVGDPNYVENVLSYLGPECNITMKDSNHETIHFTVQGKQKTKALS